MRVEHIGDATLYLADCRDVLPTLGKVDAVVTDPPYGLGARLANSSPNGEWGMCSAAALSWDTEPAHAALHASLALSRHQIVWGGNYYTLPPARCWLLWDKMQEHSGAHAEMAWTTLDKPVRTFRMCRAVAHSIAKKEHPTQKPLPLMQWCIEQLPDDAGVILDPFMGSGTTGVACAHEGRRFIGIEREPAYFDIACKRIADAYAQPRLFAPSPPAKPVQPSMFEGVAA